ncbi:hypothetical protein [Pontibacter liquoris]|uniref:hypothetical protein n=1 Tax=Pontibacter liquoris TaxID=2905677 RepID=UPI001FA713E8|nr:hypothetical protein [Pontibacter liquoris]
MAANLPSFAVLKQTCALLLLALLPLLGRAQSKRTAPAALWPELQLSYGVGSSGHFFLWNQYRINTDEAYNDLTRRGPLSHFERIELTLGYEHTFSAHWRGGALVRYAAENYPKTGFYTLFLRHNGQIGNVYFNKQALFAYAHREAQQAVGQFLLKAEAGRRFPVGQQFLTPVVSYEVMLLQEFNQDKTAPRDERIVDRTRLQLGLTYELTEKLRLTPYVLRQTDYYYVLIPPVYDELGQLQKDGYTSARNRITPVVGLELKYSLHTAPNTASITY